MSRPNKEYSKPISIEGATPPELLAAEKLKQILKEAIIDRSPDNWSREVREQISALRWSVRSSHLNQGPEDLVVFRYAERLRIPELVGCINKEIAQGLNATRAMQFACKMLLTELMSVIEGQTEVVSLVNGVLPPAPRETGLPFPISYLSIRVGDLARRAESDKRPYLGSVASLSVLELLQLDRKIEWSDAGGKRAVKDVFEALTRLHPALRVLFSTTKELGLTRSRCEKLRATKVPFHQVKHGALCTAEGAGEMAVTNGWGLLMMSRWQLDACLTPESKQRLAQLFREAGFTSKA